MAGPKKYDPAVMGKKLAMDKNQGKTLKRLMSLITKPYKFSFIMVFVCILVNSVVSAASALFIGSLIDEYISPLLKMSVPDYSNLIIAIIVMAGIFLAGILSTLAQHLLMVRISQGVMKNIRDNMFRHMQTLPVKYFDTHTHGDVMSYYTNDIDTLRQMISQSIPQLMSSVITIVVYLVMMFATNVWLTLFVLLFVAFTVFVSGKVAGKSGKYFVEQQKALGKENGFIEEMINGQKVVKVFNRETHAKDDFDKLNDQLGETSYKANKFVNILGPINGNLGHLQYVCIAVFGGILAISGFDPGLTLGVIATFLISSRSFSMPINQVSQQAGSIVMALAGAKRIFDLLDEESEADNGYVTLVNAKYENGEITECKEHTGLWAWKHPHQDGTLTYHELKGEVVLSEVDFAYVEGKTVLQDISLYAEPGQKVAFVGATGAGKTTITNLINRFYDIEDGKIRYDGINLNKIKKYDLRRSLGIVLQETNLFTGTVADNIRYGKLDATEEEIVAAAKLANAHDFITRLPKGYDTELTGNGANLSQGQRQLISIARAAIADPPVMILDEATSSIDTRTESLVQRGMDALMKGRTVFVIAHRLSTVKNSDVIMVLDKGRIIERGSHDDLITKKGQYYKLYTGAFELE
ncbi:MAG: ABC transporter ATP-binding protein [Ruminococcaceae bacterium]|nr:ABC transporter ATP-binding protein [Oscillospiraceae bacterium]